MSRFRRRKLVNYVMLGLAGVCTAIVLVPLVSLLALVISRGLAGLNLEFFTQLPKPVGEPGGGMANAIVGTLTMVTMACILGLPVGILAGTYLSEFGRGPLAGTVRFMSDVLTGVPSIVVGIFVNVVVVIRTGHFSAYAGALALAIIMIPLVTRTTEEMLRMVPNSLREASLALGATRARTVGSIVYRSASAGLITGSLLAVARVAGETAPLLFTALNNRFWHHTLSEPIASLPVYIYRYAISPYKDWQQQAWTAALVLVLMVLTTSVAARIAVSLRK
ncbi:MAG: phosphate ABC transporter permease PstA [Clostridia bacterium]|nr:MAG: phosphate ABC transporter permease PstA [Clostridia bacterium]